MAKAKNAKTVSAHVPNEVAEEIERRANALDGLRKSTYAAMILIKWFEDGAKPISELDEFRENQKKSKLTPAKTQKRRQFEVNPQKSEEEEAQ